MWVGRRVGDGGRTQKSVEELQGVVFGLALAREFKCTNMCGHNAHQTGGLVGRCVACVGVSAFMFVRTNATGGGNAKHDSIDVTRRDGP